MSKESDSSDYELCDGDGSARHEVIGFYGFGVRSTEKFVVLFIA